MRTRARMLIAAIGPLAAGSLIALGGCAGGGSGAEPVNTGLDSIDEGEDPGEGVELPDPDTAMEDDGGEDPGAWDQAAMNLQSVLEETERSGVASESGSGRRESSRDADAERESRPDSASDRSRDDAGSRVPADEATRGEDEPAPGEAGAEDAGAEPASDPSPDEGATGGEEPDSPEVAGQRLASALRESMSRGEAPLAAGVRLAMLEAIHPGAASATGAELRSELGQRGLMAHEPDVVLAARSLARDLVEATEAGRPVGAMLDALGRAAADLNEASPQFRVRAAALCTRVHGLASYDEFDRNVFLAGDPHRVIVYSELERFGHRKLGGAEDSGSSIERRSEADRWAIELSQELTLYHEPEGDLQAWHQPGARVVETVRRRIDAMHLVNEIVLPARLTVGRYTLKVTTRDETTGATDEAAIPIRVVADPALVTAELAP